jgi:hypothetical protein
MVLGRGSHTVVMCIRGGRNGVQRRYRRAGSTVSRDQDGDALDRWTLFGIIYLHPLPTALKISDVPDPIYGLVRSMFRRLHHAPRYSFGCPDAANT